MRLSLSPLNVGAQPPNHIKSWCRCSCCELLSLFHPTSLHTKCEHCFRRVCIGRLTLTFFFILFSYHSPLISDTNHRAFWSSFSSWHQQRNDSDFKILFSLFIKRILLESLIILILVFQGKVCAIFHPKLLSSTKISSLLVIQILVFLNPKPYILFVISLIF